MPGPTTPVMSLITGPASSPGAITQFNNFFAELVHDNITAFAGGAQVGATQIQGQTARVTTVVTAGDSVMLPQALPGMDLMVINDAANTMTVWPFATDTIDKLAVNTGILHMGQSVVIYVCITQGNWRTEGLATGFGGSGLQTISGQDGLTAKAGGGQYAPGAGPLINRMVNRVTTVVTAADSITLPASVAGMQIILINAAAANSMNVFPASGEAINALGANAAFAIAGATGKAEQFVCVTAGQWHTIP